MAGDLAIAFGWFVLFALVAGLMFRSALHDWREGRRRGDTVSLLSAVMQSWPAVLAAAVSVVPLVVVLRD
jgi:hypothetical protein